ncbi:hypothetical protein PXH59_18960 [Xenorhabdus sp. SF857]|uniref:hypothetical protein n=1 Tax=Xenorhabdus bakwenae TaxID=3026967 RepID=UPI002557D150|nr:hypothetical protein [Xenorhabdus sp. SF857]WFQ79598.1 hypothetical protein PXH59_18960 [Xenorhabdus sp. SF857]
MSFCRSSLRAGHGDGVLPVQSLILVRMNASLIMTWCDFSFLLHQPVARQGVKKQTNKRVQDQKMPEITGDFE